MQSTNDGSTEKGKNISNIVEPRAPFRTAGPREFVSASPPLVGTGDETFDIVASF